jgi:hypothetical protein
MGAIHLYLNRTWVAPGGKKGTRVKLKSFNSVYSSQKPERKVGAFAPWRSGRCCRQGFYRPSP